MATDTNRVQAIAKEYFELINKIQELTVLAHGNEAPITDLVNAMQSAHIGHLRKILTLLQVGQSVEKQKTFAQYLRELADMIDGDLQ